MEGSFMKNLPSTKRDILTRAITRDFIFTAYLENNLFHDQFQQKMISALTQFDFATVRFCLNVVLIRDW